MARVILGSYMVRYPLGGMMSWVLQYLVGFQRLGHDVYFVEKSGYPRSCYDPVKNVMSDDCSYGVATLNSVLARFDLADKWCFVDAAGRYHGLSREHVEAVFKSAELFVDMGTHGSWLEEATGAGLRVLIDGEPGFTQMKMEKRLAAGGEPPDYDVYYTTGRNVGTENSTAPTAGKQWRPLFHPVVVSLFCPQVVNVDAPFTTVMNWQSYEPLEYNGTTYGHKDVEFKKFIDLPSLATTPVELAVSGENVPFEHLINTGWRIRDAHRITASVESFKNYIYASKGELSVCKNGYVMTNCGWFSDRSAAYLASSRPVVMQDTGFSAHIPCGQGLFAVCTVDEAAAAINEISSDYERHSTWAREVAIEYLDAPRVLGRFLHELGVS
jgi:hypothetical protein